MKRIFCDICSNPASNNLSIAYRVKFGEEYPSYKNSSKSMKQCYVMVYPVVRFDNHETGYGGPPDLCRACILDLLDGLKREAEKA